MRLARRLTLVLLVCTSLIGVGLAAAPIAAGAGAQAAKPGEHSCGAGRKARCGTVTVPLDRSGLVSGSLQIGYERYPHTDRSRPALETIVAIEGGPGYPTTESRSYYLPLFRPMMARHDLLLVDLRGTGTSGVIDCEPLQHIRYPYVGWIAGVRACGKQLGEVSNLYSTSDASDDLVSVIDALGLNKIDLYGDSYGTFFSQVFAIRHPARLRALVLDAAYPVEGTDPWWRDLSRAARSGYRLVCRRDHQCASLGGDPVRRLARLVAVVQKHPISGNAPNGNGRLGAVTVTPAVLIAIYDAAGYSFDPYRELDAAVRAALAPHPDDLPILRLARENLYLGGGGSVKYYSQGLDYAVACTDYPQLYDMTAAPSDRRAQYAHAIHQLTQAHPRAFSPFTVHQSVTSGDEDYDSCLGYPVPAHPHSLLPPGHAYPTVPTLVLVGDLDSVTSAEGSRTVAARFPNSTFVDVHNMVHVSAVGDSVGCASGIVRRFFRTRSAGETSCARTSYLPVRTVEDFAVHADDLPGSAAKRAALVAANTVADVMARWAVMSGSNGVGLRGGTFTAVGAQLRRWELHDVRWVEDVGVSGHVELHTDSGVVHAMVRLTGTALPHRQIGLWWNDLHSGARAVALVHTGHRDVRIEMPIP